MCQGRVTPDIVSNVHVSENLMIDIFDEQEDQVPGIEVPALEVEVDEEQWPEFRSDMIALGSTMSLEDDYERATSERMGLLHQMVVMLSSRDSVGDELGQLIDCYNMLDLPPEDFLDYPDDMSAELEVSRNSDKTDDEDGEETRDVTEMVSVTETLEYPK